MTIRPATLADLPALLRMAVDFAVSHGHDGDEIRLTKVIETLLQQGIVFVAQWPDGVYGMLAAQPFQHPITGEFTVTEVAWWVDPAYRGSSAAIRMLTDLHEYADHIGAKVIQMIQPVQNEAVGEMYRRLQYVPVETTWQRRVA